MRVKQAGDLAGRKSTIRTFCVNMFKTQIHILKSRLLFGILLMSASTPDVNGKSWNRSLSHVSVYTGEWKVHGAASMLEISEVPW